MIERTAGASAVAPAAALGALAERPHRRMNALTGEWVLVSPHRTQRPWQGQVERVAQETRPAYDPTCYLCPGNARAGGERNPRYEGTFVFVNDYAALKPGGEPVEVRGSSASGAPGDADLLLARSEPGVCHVICFSP